MRWEAQVILKSSCKIDARLFPFDTQVCKLKFSSWVYNSYELHLQILEEMDSKNLYEDVGVWELRDVIVNGSESVYDGVPYQELTYTVYLRRRPMFYTVQIIIPCILLSLINLMVFVLPPESGEKVSLGMANLLSLVLFQQLISNAVPPTSDNAPIIGESFSLVGKKGNFEVWWNNTMTLFGLGKFVCKHQNQTLYFYNVHHTSKRLMPSTFVIVTVAVILPLMSCQTWANWYLYHCCIVRVQIMHSRCTGMWGYSRVND